MSAQLTFVDLFAGLGGFAEGFMKARRHGKSLFEPLLLVDSDCSAALSFKWNYPRVRYLIRDITTLAGNDIRDLAGLMPGDSPDIVIGGPPCQGFSIIRKNLYLSDPRKTLFLHFFLRICGDLKPKMILIENVKYAYFCDRGAFLKEILDYLYKMDYLVSSKIINAHEFGVPQLRERVFIVALHNATAMPNIIFPSGRYPPIRFSRSLVDAGGEPSPEILTPYISVEEAIGDLPVLGPGGKAQKYGWRSIYRLSTC
jgi:DNA (cytosine-5)-methyltransferase 1